MKKQLLAFILIVGSALAIKAQPFVTFTCYQKNRGTTADSVRYFDPAGIVAAYVTNSKNYFQYVEYDQLGKPILTEFTIRQVPDTLMARCNKYEPTIIKLNWASTTDTFVPRYFNINRIIDVYSRATPYITYGTSQMFYNDLRTPQQPYAIVQTAATISRLTDSLRALTSTTSAIPHFDTANYTIKLYDAGVVLKSLTADTLTLLNPALFLNKGTFWVSNLGTGTYTVAGGFTVQDKSASTFSLFAATSIYALRAYYNGSAYIWSVAKVE